MNFFTRIVVWINAGTNAVGKFLLAYIAVLPGWLSIMIISAATGVILLVIFKYTSNQHAIERIRSDIKADMLTLKLFKDNICVILHAQGRMFKGALILLFYAVPPMLLMIVPIFLLLVQLGLWYQYRPLRPGQKTIITMQFDDMNDSSWPKVDINPAQAFEVTAGPSQILTKRQICWEIKARENGYHNIVFCINKKRYEKQLTIGESFMRISTKRPTWKWTDILLHPCEKPFAPDSVVRSISIAYPDRQPQIGGGNLWLICFFVISMIFALIIKPFLKVKI